MVAMEQCLVLTYAGIQLSVSGGMRSINRQRS